MLSSIVDFISDPTKMLIVTVSTLFALSALIAWKRFNRTGLLYAHLVFILSPVFYFALSINCSIGMVHGLLDFCTQLFAKFIIYALPPIMAVSFIAGAVMIPKLLRRQAKRFRSSLTDRLVKSAGIFADFYVLDRARPEAFAINRSVFISVGLFDILSDRELEAVLLHELHHVRSNASWTKFSAGFVRFFSPLAYFSREPLEAEELAADHFATELQGTKEHIESARRKIEGF